MTLWLIISRYFNF